VVCDTAQHVEHSCLDETDTHCPTIGIREFIIAIVVSSALDEKIRVQHSYMSKLNMVLIQVCSYDDIVFIISLVGY
jgi:hypothetical protein